MAKKIQKLGPKQERWLSALESGRYKQTDGVLFDGKRYCCLGVACHLEGAKLTCDEGYSHKEYSFDGSNATLPLSVQNRLKFRNDCGGRKSGNYELASLNDEQHLNFREIAALIRANPAEYFKGPA